MTFRSNTEAVTMGEEASVGVVSYLIDEYEQFSYKSTCSVFKSFVLNDLLHFIISSLSQ